MPIYEYRCRRCGRDFERLVSIAHEAPGACPDCGDREPARRYSGFATHRSEEARLTEYRPDAARDPGFYRDPRNIGLGAKKRARELGADAGGRLDEIVERARTGRFLEG